MRRAYLNEELAFQLLKRAIELGVDVIDTADYYGSGLANRIISESLTSYSGNL